MAYGAASKAGGSLFGGVGAGLYQGPGSQAPATTMSYGSMAAGIGSSAPGGATGFGGGSSAFGAMGSLGGAG